MKYVYVKRFLKFFLSKKEIDGYAKEHDIIFKGK